MNSTKRRFSTKFRSIVWLVIAALTTTSIGPLPSAFAQTVINLPKVGTMVPISPVFNPVQIKGIQVYADTPLRFDFLVDKGGTKLTGEPLKGEVMRLVKYFLTSLTVPQSDMWVNLSPYEQNRIVPNQFGITHMGKDLLEQDYLLKQMMASLSYPEQKLGEAFWSRVYKKAHELYGTSKIPINTFNKVWIIPKTAEVYVRNNSAFVVNSELDVMMEIDYAALKINKDQQKEPGQLASQAHDQYSDAYIPIFREIILPELRREVNEGENFAVVRQAYNAMILATWYKRHLWDTYLGKNYVGKNKVFGVDIEDKNSKEKIFEQYLESFKKGVYDYIRSDFDAPTQQMIKRRYVSGGVDFVAFGKIGDQVYRERKDPEAIDDMKLGPNSDLAMVSVSTNPRTAKGVMVSLPDRRGVSMRHPFEQVQRETSSKAGLQKTALKKTPQVPKVSRGTFISRLRGFLPSVVLTLSLTAAGLFAVPATTDAATFAAGPNQTIIVTVDEGDRYGDIVQTIRKTFKTYDREQYHQSGYVGSMWGKKGNDGVVSRLAKGADVETLSPGQVLTIDEFFPTEALKLLNKGRSASSSGPSRTIKSTKQKIPVKAPIKQAPTPPVVHFTDTVTVVGAAALPPLTVTSQVAPLGTLVPPVARVTTIPQNHYLGPTDEIQPSHVLEAIGIAIMLFGGKFVSRRWKEANKKAQAKVTGKGGPEPISNIPPPPPVEKTTTNPGQAGSGIPPRHRSTALPVGDQEAARNQARIEASAGGPVAEETAGSSVRSGLPSRHRTGPLPVGEQEHVRNLQKQNGVSSNGTGGSRNGGGYANPGDGLGGKKRDPIDPTKLFTTLRPLDFMGVGSGLVLAGGVAVATFGMSALPVVLIGAIPTAIALSFATRFLYSGQLWIHEVLGHAVPKAAVHPLQPKLWWKIFSPANLRANLTWNQWLEYLLPWRDHRDLGIFPQTMSQETGWRDSVVAASGFVASAAVGIGLLTTLGTNMEHTWLIPLLGPLATSLYSVLQGSWRTDVMREGEDGLCNGYACGNVVVGYVDENGEIQILSGHVRFATGGPTLVDSAQPQDAVMLISAQGSGVLISNRFYRRLLGMKQEQRRETIKKVVRSKRGLTLPAQMIKEFSQAARRDGNKVDEWALVSMRKMLDKIVKRGGQSGGLVKRNRKGEEKEIFEINAASVDQKRSITVVRNGRFADYRPQRLVVIVSHNGDNDAKKLPRRAPKVYLHDRKLTIDEIRTFFPKLFYQQPAFKYRRLPNGEAVDLGYYPGRAPSSVIAGQPDEFGIFWEYVPLGDTPPMPFQLLFSLNQGIWETSVTFADVNLNSDTADQVLANIIPEDERDALSEIFRRVFYGGFAQQLDRPDEDNPEKDWQDFWATPEMVAEDEKWAYQYNKIQEFKAAVVQEIEKETASPQKQDHQVLRRWNRSPEARQEFVDLVVERFFIGNRNNSAIVFNENAEGSYGLVIRDSINDDGVTILSRQQGMSVGFNLKTKFFTAASDLPSMFNEYGDRGSLESTWTLDQQGKGQIAEVGFNRHSKQLEMSVYDANLKRELTDEEVAEWSYPLTDNEYYTPPIEYPDEYRAVEQDIEQTTAAIKDLNDRYKNPESKDGQTIEHLAEQLASRYIEDYLKDNSAAYQGMRGVVLDRVHDLAQECTASIACSPELRLFFEAELVRNVGSADLFYRLIRQRVDERIIEEADRLTSQVISKTVNPDALYQLKRQLDPELTDLIREQLDILMARLMDNFSETRQRLNEFADAIPTQDEEEVSHEVELQREKQLQEIVEYFFPDAKNKISGLRMKEKGLQFLAGAYSDSEWITNHYLINLLSLVLPDLRAGGDSSNTILQSPQKLGIDPRTIAFVASKSGSTSPSLGQIEILNEITGGNLFLLTSRWDSMNRAVGQRLTPGAPFTRRILTLGNYYPTEAPTISEDLLAAAEINLVVELAKRLKEMFPNQKPFGLRADSKDLQQLEALRDNMVADSRRVNGFDEDMQPSDNPTSEAIGARALYLGNRIREPFMVKIWTNVATAMIVHFGTPIASTINLIFGTNFGHTSVELSWHNLGNFTLNNLDTGLIVFMTFILTTQIYRRFMNQSPQYSRLGAPSLVIGESPANFKAEENLAAKLVADAPSSMGVHVYADDPEKDMISRLGYRVVRGTQVLFGKPSNLESSGNYETVLKQIKGITSPLFTIFGKWFFKGGPEVTTMGRGDFHSPNATNHHINLGPDPLPADASEFVREFDRLATDPFLRKLAFKSLLAKTFKRASEFDLVVLRLSGHKSTIIRLWNMARTYLSVSVHTTRSPIGLNKDLIRPIVDLFKKKTNPPSDPPPGSGGDNDAGGGGSGSGTGGDRSKTTTAKGDREKFPEPPVDPRDFPETPHQTPQPVEEPVYADSSHSSDAAMLGEVNEHPHGGIDLDGDSLKLRIINHGPSPVFIQQKPLESIPIDGLVPQIFEITPVTPATLQMILGQSPESPSDNFSSFRDLDHPRPFLISDRRKEVLFKKEEVVA